MLGYSGRIFFVNVELGDTDGLERRISTEECRHSATHERGTGGVVHADALQRDEVREPPRRRFDVFQSDVSQGFEGSTENLGRKRPRSLPVVVIPPQFLEVL